MSDNDNFLADLDAAVEGAGNDESFDDIANDTAKAVTTDVTDDEPDQKGQDKLERELLDLTDNDDDREAAEAKKKRETLSLDPDAVDGDRKAREAQQQKDAEKQLPPREDANAQTAQQQKRQRAFMDRFLQEDDKGNLLAPNGTIVAMKGDSRWHFEGVKREAREHRDKAERLAMDNADLGRQLQEREAAYKQLQESDTVKPLIERTGMDENELNDAISFLRAYKQDPLDGIKKILTKARANGIDISSLGVHGGLDLNVIRDMIRNEVQPRNAEPPAQRSQDPQEVKQAIEQEVTTLVNDDQDAKDILLGTDEEAQRLRQVFLAGVSKYPDVPIARLWYSFKQKLRDYEEKQTSTTPTEKKSMWRKTEQQEPRTAQPRKAAASRNYGTMTFDEIARSVMDDRE